MDRDTVEHLVAGTGVGAVASVLRAAAAPAYRDELAGEDAAVAAFRAAATVEPGRQPVFRKAIAKALTIKVAIVLAIAGSTGVVLAASEGALPMPWSNSPAGPPATTTTPAPGSPGARTPDGRQPPANPDPAIVGLCEAYVAHEDKNLDNPAFRALVEAAGGKAEVPAYCELVEAATSSATAEPGRPTPSGKPAEPGDDPDRKPATPPATPPSPPTKTQTRTERPGPTERPGVTELPTEPDQPARPSKTTRTTKKEPASDPTVEDAATRTPGSPAPGAATAVPPSGAEPPSTGG
jgi:hypothetical protein